MQGVHKLILLEFKMLPIVFGVALTTRGHKRVPCAPRQGLKANQTTPQPPPTCINLSSMVLVTHTHCTIANHSHRSPGSSRFFSPRLCLRVGTPTGSQCGSPGLAQARWDVHVHDPSNLSFDFFFSNELSVWENWVKTCQNSPNTLVTRGHLTRAECDGRCREGKEGGRTLLGGQLWVFRSDQQR